MRVAILLAFVVSGCAPLMAVDGYDTVVECNASAPDCAGWTPDVVVAVLNDFGARWVVLFAETPAFPTIIVVEEVVLFGLADGYANGTSIHVTGPPDRWTTAHELVHNALRAKTGNGDPDHADGDGPWTADHDLLVETAAITRARP